MEPTFCFPALKRNLNVSLPYEYLIPSGAGYPGGVVEQGYSEGALKHVNQPMRRKRAMDARLRQNTPKKPSLSMRQSRTAGGRVGTARKTLGILTASCTVCSVSETLHRHPPPPPPPRCEFLVVHATKSPLAGKGRQLCFKSLMNGEHIAYLWLAVRLAS